MLLQRHGIYISDWCYELDKRRRLHVHALVRCPLNKKFSSILDSKTIHYEFSPIYTKRQKEGWLDYIYKDGYDDCESEHEPIPKRKLFYKKDRIDDWDGYEEWCESWFEFPTQDMKEPF